ncbi:MAG: HIT family protein [Candidatus Ranarchaeia archaeon]
MMFNPRLKGTPKPKASDSCTFCEIISGKRQADFVLKEKDYVAFLDIRPHGLGHTLVIPRKHYRWVWDIPRVGDILEVARRIVRGIQAAFNPHLVIGGIVGDEVEHAHLHLIPRYKSPPKQLSPADIAKKIRENIP